MTVYIDEALLDAAGLMDFSELYAYIRERESRHPIETAPPVPVGDQTLLEQVKINANILENTNEVFVPPEPNMPFEALKQINYDSNNDGKVDIMDVWNGSGQGTHEAQSYEYDVMKKQSDLVDHHIEGTVLHNFLNNDIKLIDKFGIYKTDRAAYYIQDGPIVIFSFGAKLEDNIQNIYIIFSTVDNKILPPYAKYHALHANKIKLLISKVGKCLSWVNNHVVKSYVLPAAKQFSGLPPGGSFVTKGIEAQSSAPDAFNVQGSKQEAKNKFNDLMDDPYLRNLPIESLSRLIKLRGGQS
ncbi:MAG: hypothetical protein EZS28_002838 [Streblomastix strix]|uniref:EF-hand domain-containing protein n=1 Tax=Streblomastix strix TaxID=222440 RepID=A0A5J4X4P1_9EUKA|nr:MAG: hypothetical protein EZS28_002838 [Streblomastix strix]